MPTLLLQKENADGTIEFVPMDLVETSSGESAGLVVSESQADWRGNYPATWYLEWTGTAGAANNAVVYQNDDVSMYNYHTFTVSGTNRCDIEVSHDGTTWDVIHVKQTDSVATLNDADYLLLPYVLTGKTGFIYGKFKHIRVLQDGVTDANCVGAHSVI